MRYNNMMFTNKKGVSPIIAAVLLVVITIAIGATTMAFIRGLSDQNLASAQEKAGKIKCGTDVRAEVLVVGSDYKICESGDSLSVTLKNTGSVDIKYFELTVLGNGTDGYDVANSNTSAAKFEKNTIGKFNITFVNGSALGTPVEYVLSPVIQGEPGQDVICSDSPIQWDSENVPACS
jgi:flagellin-like protein